tara:strand:+ start:95 stop:508 length:414 start_codon:yes stop_codon:yes gene_type:complete
MELKIGLKFRVLYAENNIRDSSYSEVRAIVDDSVIVLLCKEYNGESYYKTLTINSFKMRNKVGWYTEIIEKEDRKHHLYYRAILQNANDFTSTDTVSFDINKIKDFESTGWTCVSGKTQEEVYRKAHKILFAEDNNL